MNKLPSSFCLLGDGFKQAFFCNKYTSTLSFVFVPIVSILLLVSYHELKAFYTIFCDAAYNRHIFKNGEENIPS